MNDPDLMVAYFNTQAEGAFPNGAIVVKRNSQPDDGTPDGTRGNVIGSIDVTHMKKPARFAYCVLWTYAPVPVFIADTNNDGTIRLEMAK
jgi:hypothetical protein